MIISLAVIAYLIVGAGHVIGLRVRDHTERFLTLLI